MNSNEDLILTIHINNDVEKKCYIRKVLSVSNTDYIALTPIDNEDGLIELYRLTYDEDDNILLSDLESDEEVEEVRSTFINIVGNPADETVISVMDDDGTIHLCEIIQTFTYDSHDYIALLPTERKNGEEKSIQLFSYKVTEANEDLLNLYISEIPSHIYDSVATYFSRCINDSLCCGTEL